MNDLETTGLRSTAASITPFAGGKLRGISGPGVRFGETDALVDAFAEVFAQMSISAPPPAKEHDAASDVKLDDRDANDQPRAADNEGDQHDRNDEPDSQPLAIAKNQSIAVDQSTANQDIDASEQANSGDDDAAVLGNLGDDQGEAANQRNDRNANSGEIGQTNVGPTETIDAIRTAGAAIESGPSAKETLDKRRTADQSAAGEPATAVPSPGEQKPKREQVGLDQPQHAAELSDQRDDAAGDQQSGQPRRTRRQQRLQQIRENGQTDRPAPQSDRGNAGGQPSATAAVDATAADSLGAATTKTETSALEQPVASKAEATINSVQNAAAKTNTAPTNRGPSDSRGATESIQSSGETNRIDTDRRRETRGPQNSSTDTTARVKLVQRVSRAFQHLGPDGGMVRLKLAPAELGSVRIEMRVEKQSIRARVVTETEAASATLREHLPDLKARLESYGMQVEQIEVETETNDSHNGSPFDRETEQREQSQQQHRRRSLRPQSRAPQEQPSRVERSSPHRIPTLLSQGVDLRL